MSTASLFLFLYRQLAPVTQTDWPTCAAATREDNQPITRQRQKTEDDLLQFKPSSTRAGPSVSEAADVLGEENGSRKQVCWKKKKSCPIPWRSEFLLDSHGENVEPSRFGRVRDAPDSLY